MTKDKPLIFIPTYNEIGNVVKLYKHLKSLQIDLDLLFIDDCSPDGTGGVLDSLAKQDNNLYVIHRKEKLGIGSAHKDGIAWAYTQGYKLLVTMDSDYSHSPDDIERFIKLSEESDLIVGSRYLENSSMGELSLFRGFLSSTAHRMTQFFLRMPYDSTNAFRLYRLDRIKAHLFDQITSNSYSFFFESLYIIHSKKISITETPIKLGGRQTGDSKMSIYDSMISVKTLVMVTYKKYFKGL